MVDGVGREEDVAETFCAPCECVVRLCAQVVDQGVHIFALFIEGTFEDITKTHAHGVEIAQQFQIIVKERCYRVARWIAPGGGVVGNIGVAIVALGAGCVGLDRIGGEEAPERGVEVARPQVPQAGLLGIGLAGEAAPRGHPD